MKTITCDHELIALVEGPETLKLDASKISFEILQSLSRLSNLKELYISIGRVTEDFIMIILSLTKLHTLDISCGRLMPGAFRKLYLITSLRNFNFFCKLMPEIVDLEPLSLVTQLTSFRLRTIRGISEENLFFISSLVNLTSLDLDAYYITDVLGSKLNTLKKLKKLKISGTDSGLECLSSFRDLEVLDLSASGITEKTLVHILKMNNLMSLNLSGCNKITDTYCFDTKYSEPLFENLVDLDLSRCTGLTGGLLAAIGENARLRTLKLEDCLNIAQKSFNNFKDLSNLIYADLSGCILLENLSFLEQAKQLDQLYLARCNGVKDMALQSLRQVPALTTLSVAHCKNLSDEGMKYIGEVFSLLSLNCFYCNQVSAEGIKEIRNLYALEYLGLSGCNITTDALNHLRFLRHLTALNLSCCRNLTEIDIKTISTFPSLIVLYLDHCEQLSIKELRHLKKLKTLKKLCLDDCFDIPEDKLQKILPNVDIWI